MALEYFNKLLKDYPDDLTILTYIGRSYLFMGNVDEALSYFNKAYLKNEIVKDYVLFQNVILN